MSHSFIPGDHLKVVRGLYSHHGIYVGEDRVIHYSGELKSKANASIRCDALADFAAGGTVEVIAYGAAFPGASVIARASSRVGEAAYSLPFSNCEHFARWCKTGEHRSEQVRDGVAGVAGAGTGAGTTAAALGVVSAGGTVAGLSGAGVMSGLASVGGVFGTGAVGGVVALGAAPAACAVIAMRQGLGDDAVLPAEERSARQVGRASTVVGAAAGTVGTVATISVAGTVTGLSAAGITSGLAAIGATVGGGMAAGAAVVVAAPAVASVALGYGLYRAVRRLKRRQLPR